MCAAHQEARGRNIVLRRRALRIPDSVSCLSGYYPGRKADHDPCRLARQVNEFCERAARTVNQRLDPCQLVWQVNESGSENGVSREDSFTCRTSRQGSSLASRVSHLANKTTSPAGQARRGRVSKLLAEVIPRIFVASSKGASAYVQKRRAAVSHGSSTSRLRAPSDQRLQLTLRPLWASQSSPPGGLNC